MMVGVSGGVHDAVPPEAAVLLLDEVHAASATTLTPTSAGMNRRNNHRGMSPSFEIGLGHGAPSHTG
jgi:hypothetical protein